jgi:hypothetical protein
MVSHFFTSVFLRDTGAFLAALRIFLGEVSDKIRLSPGAFRLVTAAPISSGQYLIIRG